MEIRYPNYYKKFHCIAGACPDTCCAGWQGNVLVAEASPGRSYGFVQSLLSGKQLNAWSKAIPVMSLSLATE